MEDDFDFVRGDVVGGFGGVDGGEEGGGVVGVGAV